MREYTVDVLGTPYQVKIIPSSQDPMLKDCDGYCDKTTKIIVVDDCTENCDYMDPSVYVRKVTRHEIIHAFLFESGLGDCWEHKQIGQEETTVDWIAVMIPKLMCAFMQAEAV